jgi:hypothetical protein
MPAPGEPRAVNAPNPEDDATEVKLENPVVRLRGPWLLEIAL